MEIEAPDELLRPAIELAFVVAVTASRSQARVEVPAPLRPYLKLSKLPERALQPVRRVVDTNDAFREMLLPAATEDLVGRAGWLWLHRPDGWEAELAELVDEAVRADAGDIQEREERSARRRLESVQSALDHARSRALKAEATNARLRSELAAARKELAQLKRRPSPAVVAPTTTRAAPVADPPVRSPTPLKAPASRRAAVAIPGGLSLRSRPGVEAALRTPGLQLVVDGYNVTLRAWPELELAEQRQRLLDVLDELGARFGLRPVVVFDGASAAAGGGSRRFVHVQFSPAGVTADDDLVAHVRALPVETPVLAATSDQELARRLAGLGAEVITTEALLTACRRG